MDPRDPIPAELPLWEELQLLWVPRGAPGVAEAPHPSGDSIPKLPRLCCAEITWQEMSSPHLGLPGNGFSPAGRAQAPAGRLPWKPQAPAAALRPRKIGDNNFLGTTTFWGPPHRGWVILVHLRSPGQILSHGDLFPVFFSRHDVRILIT